MADCQSAGVWVVRVVDRYATAGTCAGATAGTLCSVGTHSSWIRAIFANGASICCDRILNSIDSRTPRSEKWHKVHSRSTVAKIDCRWRNRDAAIVCCCTDQSYASGWIWLSAKSVEEYFRPAAVLPLQTETR